jgi:hypothetical protein
MLALGGEGQQKLPGEESFRWPFFVHERKPSIGAASPGQVLLALSN